MTAAAILLAILVVTGLLLRITHRPDQPGETAPEPSPQPSHGPLCCGRHAVCDKFPLPGDRPVYYDDEELDRFTGRNAADYDDAEIEEFRDVLLTMLPGDVAGWTVSLGLRGIALPAALRDEAVMIIGETCNTPG